MSHEHALAVDAGLHMHVLPLCSTGHQATTDDAEPWPTPTCNADRQNWTMGLIYCNDEASKGYTLFSPIPSNTTYLIDHEGRELHQWSSPGEHRPALSAYLLPDGDLLRTRQHRTNHCWQFFGRWNWG